jgi:hypothetical protein
MGEDLEIAWDLMKRAGARTPAARARFVVRPEFNETVLKQLSEASGVSTTRLRAEYLALYGGLSEGQEYDVSLRDTAIRLAGRTTGKQSQPFVYAFDGAAGQLLLADSRLGFLDPHAGNRYSLLLRDPARLGRLILQEYTADQEEQLRQAFVNGTAKWLGDDGLLEVEYRDPWQPYICTVRCDLARDGLVVYENRRFLSGRLVDVVEVIDTMRLSTGQWVATGVRETDYQSVEGEPKAVMSLVLELQEYEEVKAFPPSTFRLVFPEGTRVVDRISGVTYVVGLEVERTAETVKHLSEEPAAEVLDTEEGPPASGSVADRGWPRGGPRPAPPRGRSGRDRAPVSWVHWGIAAGLAASMVGLVAWAVLARARRRRSCSADS